MNRRDFLRWLALAALGLLTVHLRRQPCDQSSGCAACRRLQHCRQPAAQSFRQQQRRPTA